MCTAKLDCSSPIAPPPTARTRRTARRRARSRTSRPAILMMRSTGGQGSPSAIHTPACALPSRGIPGLQGTAGYRASARPTALPDAPMPCPVPLYHRLQPRRQARRRGQEAVQAGAQEEPGRQGGCWGLMARARQPAGRGRTGALGSGRAACLPRSLAAHAQTPPAPSQSRRPLPPPPPSRPPPPTTLIWLMRAMRWPPPRCPRPRPRCSACGPARSTRAAAPPSRRRAAPAAPPPTWRPSRLRPSRLPRARRWWTARARRRTR